MEQIRSALRNILRKRTRSLLTAVSIAIGVAAVVLTGTVGEMGRTAVAREIDSLGIGGISVTADKRLRLTQLYEDDLELIEGLDASAGAIPVMMKYGRATMHGLVAQTVAWGVGAGADQIISLEMLHGRLIDSRDVEERRAVCVVDENAAKTFYGRSNITGKRLTLLLDDCELELEVAGVAASGGNALQSLIGEYFPAFVYVPYTTLQEATGQDWFDQIAVRLTDGADADAAGSRIVRALEASNGIRGGYLAQNMAQQRDKLTRLLDIVSASLSGVAAISLVVSGLGTTTVMLVSVRERTREIGIKRAIGARRGTILREFMLEAAVLSLAGGVLGAAVGSAAAAVIQLALGLDISLDLPFIAFCVAFSTLGGVVFGVYPSRKAASLDPVEALRQE
mgnify:CR=1 FL=1